MSDFKATASSTFIINGPGGLQVSAARTTCKRCGETAAIVADYGFEYSIASGGLPVYGDCDEVGEPVCEDCYELFKVANSVNIDAWPQFPREMTMHELLYIDNKVDNAS